MAQPPIDRLKLAQSLLSSAPHLASLLDGTLAPQRSVQITTATKRKPLVRVLCAWAPDALSWVTPMTDPSDAVTFTSGPGDYTVILNHPYGTLENDPHKHGYDPETTIIFQLEPWCSDPKQNWGIKTWGPWARPTGFMSVRSHSEHVNLLHWELCKTKQELLTDGPVPKNKVISCVTGGKYFDPGHITRIDLLKYLDAHPLVVNGAELKVDVYGHENPHGIKSYLGPHPPGNKNPGMLPYRYYLHAENNAETNFITEKIWDSILSEAVCFYWGCPNISDHVDPACYILIDAVDHARSRDIISQAIENDEWSKRVAIIRQEKLRLLTTQTLSKVVELEIARVTLQPVHVLIHVCTLGDGREILLDQLRRIKRSGLYTRCAGIHVSVTGPPLEPHLLLRGCKISVVHVSTDPRASEIATVRHFLQTTLPSLPDQSLVLYMHTKGITRSGEKRVRVDNWRLFMEYALVENFQYVLRRFQAAQPASPGDPRLPRVDAIGVNLVTAPLHFSGNFWWATKRYLSSIAQSLETTMFEYRDGEWFRTDTTARTPEEMARGKSPSVEFWILSHPQVRALSIVNTNLDHYITNYPPELFRPLVDKSIKHLEQSLELDVQSRSL